MADEDANLAPNGGTGPAPSSAPTIDPAEYESLRSFREEVGQRLTPIADDVQWMLSDEANLKFIREARRTYDESRRSREPELDESAKRVLGEIAPIKEYVTAQQKREHDAQVREQEKFIRQARSERDALVAQRPWLAEHNGAGVMAIAAYGDRLGISSLAEAAKAFDAAGAPRGEKPPRSLRSEASAAGVPGPSSAPPIKSPKDIRDRLKHAFAAGGRSS